MGDTQGFANPLGKTVTQAPGAWLDNYTKMPLTMLFPALAFVMAALAIVLSKLQKPAMALAASSLMLAGVILTAGMSMFPFVMPSSNNPNISLTMWDAVSSHMTLNVMFIAAVIFVPLILIYTTWCYVKMWRKVTISEIENNTHGSY